MPRRKADSAKPVKRGRGRPKKAVNNSKQAEQAVTSNLQLPSLSAVNLPDRRYLYIALAVLALLAIGYALYRFLVFAMVDGKPLTRITLYQQLEQRYGNDMKDQLIAEALVDSEAKKRGITVTESEIDEEYKKFEDQFGGAENIQATLMAQGISAEDFRNQIKLQTVVQRMFGNVQVSDEEVTKYLDENAEQFADATDTAKLKEEISKQLQQQKMTESFRTWLQETLQSSRVKRN